MASTAPHGFAVYHLDLGDDPFSALSAGVDFEDVTRGRRGTHLVDVGPKGVPLVRTTTRYARPARRFTAAHHGLVDAIRRAIADDPRREGAMPSFDNALIEIYERTYRKMGYHTDQALDLADDSYIALYSCYARPADRTTLRTLEVRDRVTGDESAIALEHGSVVLFSLMANARHLHRIVLRGAPGAPRAPDNRWLDNRWLGVTLRQSKTHLRFDDGQPRFADGTVLQLADAGQRKAFYRLRGGENRELAFEYPPLDYTISVADTLAPIG